MMPANFTHLDLFAGIGLCGFSRAVEWLGGTTVAFVEWDSWNRRVLAKHWPEAQFYGDIQTVTTDELDRIGHVDLITGGYPCQPFSVAGKRRGTDDDRHLWPEMRRVIERLRPRYVLAENVTGHISMGLDTVLAEMEALGYTCRPVVLPAASVNALHKRERVWIMAYASEERSGDSSGAACRSGRESADTCEPETVRQGYGAGVPERAIASGRDCGRTETLAYSERSGGREQLRADAAQGALLASLGAQGPLGAGSGREDVAVADAEGGERIPAAHGQPELRGGHARLATAGSGSRQPEREPAPTVADAISARQPGPGLCGDASDPTPDRERQAGDVVDGSAAEEGRETPRPLDPRADGLRPGLVRRPATGPAEPDLIRHAWADGSWEIDLPRVVTDEPERRQKLQAAGNAIVPICAYEILRVMLGDYDG